MCVESTIDAEEAANIVRDWLADNRDAIEAGGDGDVAALVARLSPVPYPKTAPAEK